MTSLIVDKRIVESVLKAVPTKSKSVNRSRALKITEGGWLLAFSGDGRAGFAVRITVDKDNVNRAFEARAEIEPGFYSRDALARTPIKPPKPLTALHVGWERQPGTGASLWAVAWHSDRLRAVSVPVRNGVPR